MALIKCPECGKQVSDAAKSCPGCGCPIAASNSYRSTTSNKPNYKPMIGAAVIIGIVVIGIMIGKSSSDKEDNSYRRNSYSYDYSGGYSDYTSNSYSSSSSGKDASSIFRNLDITDFSCSSGKHSGTMQCKVKNNNSFTVHGYFRVNFYDSSGSLLYNQLMSLPDVASGETVVCSTSIPKDNYPYDYATVDFSQASLVERD